MRLSQELENQNTPNRKEVLVDYDHQSLWLHSNPTTQATSGMESLTQSVVYFYFCLSGKANFGFGPHYSREIVEGKNYFFYNPERDLPFQLTLSPQSKMVVLSISLEGLHKLFMEGHDEIHFLKQEGANRKFYDEREISSALKMVLNQLFNVQLSDNAKRVFFQGKVMEILSLYFSNRQPDVESCPFLNDEEVVRKLKHAKEHLLKHLDSAPTIKELSKMAGLNEFQLKAGFKEIYGNTVYGYLLDHKLDHARALLDSKKYKVNEAATAIGYSNTSHFIAAFRKKYGITPKKYLMK